MLRVSDRIDVDQGIHLTRIDYSDGPFLVKHLNHIDFSENTCSIPNPYTQDDAKKFIWGVISFEEKNKVQRDWAIRNADGELIGCIGLLYDKGHESFRSEFGYWLSKDYWNQGLMTKVVERFANFILDNTKLIRLDALVFSPNLPSCRVLEKAGFVKEGYLRKAFCKDGKYIDAHLFAKVKET